MPRYLLQVTYTAEGARGLLKDGGSKRRQIAEQALKSAGGTLEAFYFAFGDTDAIVILDAPDNASVTAAALAINATGSVHCKTTVLLTPEEVDLAVKKTVSYRGPGQ
jgi:uncharacterized protein with GYD domain